LFLFKFFYRLHLLWNIFPRNSRGDWPVGGGGIFLY
jgi:hypothetical protein